MKQDFSGWTRQKSLLTARKRLPNHVEILGGSGHESHIVDNPAAELLLSLLVALGSNVVAVLRLSDLVALPVLPRLLYDTVLSRREFCVPAHTASRAWVLAPAWFYVDT